MPDAPIVNMFEAKTKLSQLVEAIEAGTVQEIIIARNGKPAARLTPLEKAESPVRLGLEKGRFTVPTLEAFNALDAEIAREFLGDEKAGG